MIGTDIFEAAVDTFKVGDTITTAWGASYIVKVKTFDKRTCTFVYNIYDRANDTAFVLSHNELLDNFRHYIYVRLIREGVYMNVQFPDE